LEDERDIGLYPCPKCGDFIDRNARSCPSCGTSLNNLENKDEILSISISERSFLICSKCGAFIGPDATVCNACGTKCPSIIKDVNNSEKDESIKSDSLKSTLDIYFCDNCGAFIGSKAKRCEACGIEIEGVEFDEEIEELKEPEVAQETPADKFLQSEGTLLLCNSCGAFVSPNSTICSICGLSIKDMEEPFKEFSKDEVSAESKLSTPGMLYICEKCGAFLREGSKTCNICKASVMKKLSYGDEKRALEHAKQDYIFDEKTRIDQEDILGYSIKDAEKIIMEFSSKRTKKEVIEECVKLFLRKAVALKKLGRQNEALRSISIALNLNKNDKKLELEKANMLYEMGNYEHATKIYLKLLESDSENVSLWNRVGNSLFRSGHQNESLVCFEKALSIDKNNREALINKGYILMRQEKFDEALEYANKIIVCM